MGKFIDLDVPDDVIGVRALRRIKAEGITRHQLGIILETDFAPEDQSIRYMVERQGKPIGHMTHKAWSYRLKKIIGYTLVSTEVVVGDDVVVRDGATHIAARLTQIPLPTDATATST